MSIQSEINRIKTDKESLITNLKEKGVQIADGATLGDISLNVKEIEIGTDTSDATATANDILSGKTAYVKGTKITGNINTVIQATPSVTVNSNGLITATATQSAGYIAAGTKSATKQLAFQAAKTITPTTVNQTAVAGGYYTGGDIVVKGDSNLKAENIAKGISIFGVTGTHSGGNTDVEDSIITRIITTYTNDRITTIGNYAFAYCTRLTSVNFPNCTRISSNAFYHCSRLTSISFPNCTTINYQAFYRCSHLTSISFPKCTTIGDNAFGGCYSLTSVNFPNCTTINYLAFGGCSRLTNISFPNCTSIGSYAFAGCYSLTSVSFPKCTSIGSYAFSECSHLTNISFPNCTTIGNEAFYRCYSLNNISFPKCTSIDSYAFYVCSRLTTIFLGASKVCTLANSNAFSYTGIWSNKGYIYVPSSLYSSYKTATNWVFFSRRIFSYAF